MTNFPRVRSCIICGAYTTWCCSDCALDNPKSPPVYVCTKSDCMLKHDRDWHPDKRADFPLRPWPMTDERKFYCTHFEAHVWVLSAQAEKQRCGEWAVYCMLLEQAGRSPNSAPTTNHLSAGKCVFSRTDWLEPAKIDGPTTLGG